MARFGSASLEVDLARLTPLQRQAVEAPDRQLCIVAGAGSGKTRVLTLRVARRVADEELDPAHVLVATFSRKAAGELRERLWALGVRDVETGTIHRLALRILNDHHLSTNRAPVQLTTSRRSLLQDLPTGPGTSVVHPGALDLEIGWSKARGITPDRYEEAAAATGRKSPGPRGLIAERYRDYEQLRRRRGLLDLDDLLLDAAALLRADATQLAAARWRHRAISVDECQDLNAAQRDLLVLLCGEDPDLVLVGDPNQSVYGWNGADPELLTDLQQHWGSMTTIVLRANHRSTERIVEVANAALGSRGHRIEARPGGATPIVRDYDDDLAEAEGIVALLARLRRPGQSWSQTAVLTRTNAQLQPIADALEAAGIPNRLAGGDLAPGSDLRGGDRGVPSPVEVAEGVVLSTFHRAKGLEWSAVVVAGVAEGLVPYQSATTTDQLQEERRLLYVALTRATDELAITWSRQRGAKGVTRGRRRGPSPWLQDILAAIAAMEQRDLPLDRPDVVQLIASLRRGVDASRAGTT